MTIFTHLLAFAAGGGVVFWFTERAKATAIAAAIAADASKVNAAATSAAAKIEKAV